MPAPEPKDKNFTRKEIAEAVERTCVKLSPEAGVDLRLHRPHHVSDAIGLVSQAIYQVEILTGEAIARRLAQHLITEAQAIDQDAVDSARILADSPDMPAEARAAFEVDLLPEYHKRNLELAVTTMLKELGLHGLFLSMQQKTGELSVG